VVLRDTVKDDIRAFKIGRLALLAVALCLCCRVAVIVGGQPPDDNADAKRLIEVLDLHEGSVVADIGAGSGELTILIAPRVGQAGKVYSTDLNKTRLREIRQAAAKAKLQNVAVMEGAADQTNLPTQCCDAIFMRNVYHHFAHPPVMNASLLASLKPGGRLAVVDFAPDSGASAAPGQRANGKAHGVTAETVLEEVKAAGFVDVQQGPWSSPAFLVTGRRPQ
jgi:ubiquinone/menaquinone biosynthesis C-methylase UbiE